MLRSESQSLATYKIDFFIFDIAPSDEARGKEAEAS